ncbi:MAG: methionyl-tRNA formyltransferase [Marinilabiliaceae bacterium]|nr:methionyl-tRNA formyltransferase [Marinilabiliaceae bacterium]
MGTPDFAVESLKVLVENNYHIVGVVTAPDRPAGRGQKIKQSPVKEYALSQDIPVLQPEKLKNPAFLDELKALQADLQIIVAFRMLPEVVWNMPLLGSLNLHGSLLPHYRGAAPINWAVINGEKETGVTTFFLQHEIDTGNIIFQDKVTIEEDDNAGSVHDKMMITGAQLVLKTVQAIIADEVNTTPQTELLAGAEAIQAPKIFKEDCRINWQLSATEIRNKIRGLSPYPTAWTEIEFEDGKKLSMKLFAAQFKTDLMLEPGAIQTDAKTYFAIGTNDQTLAITELQLAGKKRMTVKDFLRGYNADQEVKAI